MLNYGQSKYLTKIRLIFSYVRVCSARKILVNTVGMIEDGSLFGRWNRSDGKGFCANLIFRGGWNVYGRINVSSHIVRFLSLVSRWWISNSYYWVQNTKKWGKKGFWFRSIVRKNRQKCVRFLIDNRRLKKKANDNVRMWLDNETQIPKRGSPSSLINVM